VKLYRNGTLMLNLMAFSLLCLLILTGGLAYHGSFFPETQGAGHGEAALMWLVTALLIGIPVGTAVMWVLRLPSGKHKHH
jgi:hypothetical protein